MPRKGFRSITVRDSVYDYFEKLWRAEEAEYRLKGVSSFSGYVTMKLSELMALHESKKKGTRG